MFTTQISFVSPEGEFLLVASGEGVLLRKVAVTVKGKTSLLPLTPIVAAGDSFIFDRSGTLTMKKGDEGAVAVTSAQVIGMNSLS